MMRPQTAANSSKSKLPASLLAEKSDSAVPRYRGSNVASK